MAGVVWSPGGALLGRYSNPVTLAAGAAIPPGEYFVNGEFTLVTPNAASSTIPGGYVVSDGVNCTITAAGTAIPLGGGLPNTWPWPAPWPIGIT